MNRLQLATLMSWAGEQGIQGRKRLQKVVFFLQQAGCPLGCDYTLHYFGPYSRDVADACDEMVAAGLIDEQKWSQNGMSQYAYRLTASTQQLLAFTEADTSMQQFKDLGTKLISENLRILEIGSTILYHFNQCEDWHVALLDACEFKEAKPEDALSQAALQLAKEVKALVASN